MAAPDDLESRVTALEHQVRELDDRVRRSERDAAAARVLAGGADRDVGELRGEIRDFRQATTSSFNAMREDLADLRHNMADLRQHVDSGFAEMRREFARVDNGLAEVRGEFARVDNGFIEMRGRLDATAAGLQQIAGLITTLIEQGGQQNDQ